MTRDITLFCGTGPESVYNNVPAKVVIMADNGVEALVYVPSEQALCMVEKRGGEWFFPQAGNPLIVNDDRFMEFYLRVAR
ncbi:hypothetical protein ASE69_07750 [Sphingomonas sp. Leaf208]|uniref:hypothetical protein n=1 Tax=Sphingomonas sp. Leaf208 TaxID=1735679 RepID=UPI0006F89317|nr:hypothetical protein [Sphingomonas sp. Leaf208]KQM51201.1 hypothetical protein ASE69_07750 [Sphingomonas sp. Leaf208]